MTRLNQYFIKENYKPIAEIREIKNEIPSYEEFLETYKVDQAVENSYWLENQSQQKVYGPCIDDKNCSCGYIKSISAYENKRDGVKLFTAGVDIDGSFPGKDIDWTEVGVRTSILTLEDSNVSFRIGSGNLGVCAGNGSNLIKDRSISLNASGSGITVGRKMAVNFPFGSVGIDLAYFFKK